MKTDSSIQAKAKLLNPTAAARTGVFRGSVTRDSARIAALVFILLSVTHQAFATRRDVTSDCKGDGAGKACKYEADTHSFVRSANPLKVVVIDKTFAEDVKSLTGAVGSVDILMQQCHSGGFLQFAGQMGKPYTITTASAWDGSSWALDLPGKGKPATFVEDFTRAWRKDADLYPRDGFFDRFMLAANAGITSAKIPRDRYTPPGWTGSDGKHFEERPQYQSPDDPAGGPNDSRPLLAPGEGNRYAILVAWKKPGPAEAVDIARLNKTLRNIIQGIPLRNIVVLYGDTARGTNSGPYKGIGGDGDNPNNEDLGTFYVDGPNTRDNWVKALQGKLFVNGNDKLGITYGPNDQLFIYFNGHGGSAKKADLPLAGAGGLQYQIQLVDSFDTTISLDPDAPANNTDIDGKDLLQISTISPITDGTIELVVNGVSFGPLVDLLVTDPTQIYDIGDFVSGSTFTYQVRVDHSLLATNPQYASIGLTNASDPGMVAAFDFAGGDQEYLAIIAGN